MTTSAFLSVLGLVLSLIGVVILFRYGMPYRVETGGAIPLAIEGEDEAAKATERKIGRASCRERVLDHV